MGRRKTDDTVARGLCDQAVAAVMARGRFELSGEVRLMVLRQAGLMILYRTPFNPLPKAMGDYGIEMRDDTAGKVFSAYWERGGALTVTHFKPGPWQAALGAMTAIPVARRRTGEALGALERENRALKRTIANLTLDKLILSKAAAGEL